MKTLTLTEPWATLMLLQQKHVETRSWKPPANIIGKELAIHSAKGFPKWAQELCDTEPFRAALHIGHQYAYPELNRGKVLCAVKVLGYRHTEDVRGQLDVRELAFGDYSDGRFAWFTEYLRPLVCPNPVRGHLGVWKWE